MTLLLADGADNQFQKIYTKSSGATWVSDAGILNDGAFYIPNNTSEYNQNLGLFFTNAVAAPTNPRTLRISFWFKSSVPLTTITAGRIMNFYRGASAYDQATVVFNTPTSFTFESAYSSVGQSFVSVSTNPINILDGKWHHVFMAAKYANSGGFFKLKVDDKSFLSSSGDNIALSGDENTPTGIYFYNVRSATAGGYYLDDIVVWDSVDTGDGFSDIDLPPQRIFTLRPSADTAQAQSYPSTGATRYNILRQNDANATNGVITLEPGKKDLYEIDDLSANANIRAIIVNMAFATGNVSTKANLSVVLSANNVNVSGNTYSTQSVSISNPYSENWTVWPSSLHANNKFAYIALRDFGNSNVAWAQTSISSLQIGLEHTGVP